MVRKERERANERRERGLMLSAGLYHHWQSGGKGGKQGRKISGSGNLYQVRVQRPGSASLAPWTMRSRCKGLSNQTPGQLQCWR